MQRPWSVRRSRQAAVSVPGLLVVAVLLAGCSGEGTIPPDPQDGAPVDFAARHERMLEFVLERPAQWRAYHLARERYAREQARESWDDVMARVEAYGEFQRLQRRGDTEQFQRMLERQQRLNEGRTRDQGERWARYLERNAPPEGAQPAAGPPAAQDGAR